ncbi:MAG: YifB family Mg chelatase-like AAA ATPase [Proteobacteria bacterium]|jgi:magnesium chelatase family protein|nr:YifB family Mg chelatase-like AAA ATPase [Pseudomonadota bacterium]
MGLAKLHARALRGVSAPEVVVEVHVANGLPSFSIVGLPDIEVKESRDRVRSAIQMSGFDFPARRITVNLAPADLPKDSGRYDLAIALGVLIASGLIKCKIDINQFEFAGELALDGALRHIHGSLAIAYNATKSDRAFILPKSSAIEASLVDGVRIFAVENLNQVVRLLTKEEDLEPYFNLNTNIDILDEDGLDFSQVKGQIGVKRAIEIAASGRHSILMVGNPGCGKSMLAKRMGGILPLLSMDEAIETASLYSLSNSFKLSQWRKVPFRQPHHSSSSVAVVGGGSNPKPGEISLAHNGVLFLDEVPEFDRKVLEVLREPLETKKINIARASQKVEFPADFQLIAAMNPCPCGNKGHPQNICRCTPEQVFRYTGKLSAPLLDRIDMVVQIPQVKPEDLQLMPTGESTKEIKDRVILARKLQLQRQNKLNYELNNQEIEEYCELDTKAKTLLVQISDKMGLSARSYYRLIRVARTVADLVGKDYITSEHIAQSAQYKRIF